MADDAVAFGSLSPQIPEEAQAAPSFWFRKAREMHAATDPKPRAVVIPEGSEITPEELARPDWHGALEEGKR